MIFILEMVIHQNVVYVCGVGNRVIEQVWWNKIVFQALGGGVGSERGGTIRFAKDMFIPNDRNIWETILRNLMINGIILNISVQSHHYRIDFAECYPVFY